MNELSIMELQLERAKAELRCCDQLNALYGLVLTEADIAELVQLRSEALKSTGRVEFGGGILPKLCRVFCKSPYVDSRNYPAVLGELQDAFYYFKNECEDRFSDDELIEFMAAAFNGRAEGCADLLCSIDLEELCRWARNEGPGRYDEEEDFL